MLYIHDLPKKHKLLDIVTVSNESYLVTDIIAISDDDHKYQLTPAQDIYNALELMKKRDNELKRNGSGYLDPTAYKAIKNVESESGRFHKLLDTIYAICELSDFYIEERIVLKDKLTGRVWR